MAMERGATDDGYWLHSDRVVLGGVTAPLQVAEASLHIVGQRIVAVVAESRPALQERLGRAAAAGRPPPPVHDYGADVVAPAFIDAHIHLPMLYFRGLSTALTMQGNVVEDLFYRVETALTGDDVRAFARLGAYEALRAGTATVWEHYYFGHDAARGIADAGLCAFVAPTLQDESGPGVPWLEGQIDATIAIDDDAALRGAGVFAALGPHATDTVSPALWRRVAALAEARRLPIHAHVAQSIEELERAHARHGLSPIGLLAETGALAAERMLLVHGIYVSDADLALLDPARHVLVFCPFSQLQFSFPADVLRWSQRGLPWLIASDCAACNDGVDVQKELRFVGGMRALAASWSAEQRRFGDVGGVEAARALEAVRQAAYEAAPGWSEPAALLARVWSVPGSLDARWPVGALEVGRVASYCVYDAGHPALWPADDVLRALCYGAPQTALRELYVAGRSVGGNGGVRALCDGDEVRDASREARRRLELLLQRVGR